MLERYKKWIFYGVYLIICTLPIVPGLFAYASFLAHFAVFNSPYDWSQIVIWVDIITVLVSSGLFGIYWITYIAGIIITGFKREISWYSFLPVFNLLLAFIIALIGAGLVSILPGDGIRHGFYFP